MRVERLPLPPHFDASKVGEVWRVPYQDLAVQARLWAKQHGLTPASRDRVRICVVGVDGQITFGTPGFELFVGGRSGNGAVGDAERITRFMYWYAHLINGYAFTMDDHIPEQIFHEIFLVDEHGEHPTPFAQIPVEEVLSGRWSVHPEMGYILEKPQDQLEAHLRYYTDQLKRFGKYTLTTWPYHGLQTGIGHAIVPAVDAAVFFNRIARCARVRIHRKGSKPLTEHYSPFSVEVPYTVGGRRIAVDNTEEIDRLLDLFDAIIWWGWASSHCWRYALEDVKKRIEARGEPELARKNYLLTDCTTPVVIPGVIDFTDLADEAMRGFEKSGMHLVKSTDPIETWPGMGELLARA